MNSLNCLKIFRKKRRQPEAPILEKAKLSTIPPSSDMLSQQQCPLFNTLPAEIRNRIFHFALSPYTNKESPYPTNEYYYRPHFRYGDECFDTALLRTCRLIHSETSQIPASRYVAVEYHSRDPPYHRPLTARAFTSTVGRLQHLHLFTQQCWLESANGWTQHMKQFRSSLQTLKITLRHSDWWYWEYSEPLAFDPMGDSPSSLSLREDDLGIFHLDLRPLTALRRLEFEFETVEGKQAEMDQIVARAPAWRFPLDWPSSPPSPEPTDLDVVEEVALVLNSDKTRRWGWWGNRLRESLSFSTPTWLYSFFPPLHLKDRSPSSQPGCYVENIHHA